MEISAFVGAFIVRRGDRKMIIGTVRHVDDDAYKRGMTRVKRSFGTMSRKKTIAALEVMLESKEEVIEHQAEQIHSLKAGLTEPNQEDSAEQKGSGVLFDAYDAAELIADGSPACAGVLWLKPGDTVVLKSGRIYTREDVDSLRKAFEKAGVNVIYLNPYIDIYGVISCNA